MNDAYLVRPGQPINSFFQQEAILAVTRRINETLAKTLSTLVSPEDLAGLRDAYSQGLLGLHAATKSSRARTMTIGGPGGPIELRILVPDVVRGVYLHAHGGG